MLEACTIDPKKPTFGELLRAARERLGLTQAELGRRAGVSRVPHIEQNTQGDVRFDTMKRLAEAVGQPMSYFFGEELARPLPRAAKLELLELVAKLDDTKAELLLPLLKPALTGEDPAVGDLQMEKVPNEK